ncbi:BamA/TamA family outer membrane protein [Sphingomonas cavernae]|uniref:Bacterial surface antigen (D15) domain-containing protein n=1 Tax=Sphingomonas cavernae TaxID=2320861 RepID=A0A418WM91_9SPHN|nr:BamA/TamA family outer membrane protein [Sphingomonas cavernae]RJF91110.1 hypothetical protein D3876_13305 [Sphingomonas cavernae]
MNRALLALGLIGVTICPFPAFALEREHPVEEMSEDAQAATKSRKKADLLIVPIPQSSPTLGSGLTLAAVLFYNPNQSKDPWISGAGAMYTSNKSWGVAAFHSMALSKDRFKVLAMAGYADINVNFYGIGPNAGERGVSVDIEDRGALAVVQGQMRVVKNLHAGARYEFLDLRSRINNPNPVFPDLNISDAELRSRLSGIGPVITYDTRDSSLNPRKGIYATAVAMFNRKKLGSDFSHDKLQLAGNAYVPFGDTTVLAMRGSMCGVSTEGPFYDLCLYGQSSDLRGYETGRFRDRASWAAQAEVRQQLWGRFGLVFFGGVGGIAPKLGDLGDTKFLPSVGTGLRYQASKSTKINLRLDVAIGKNSNALYFGIGEAF